MNRSRCSLITFVIAVFLLTGCGWNKLAGGKVAAGEASQGKVAVVGGVTYAAYADVANGGKLTVKKVAGAGWVTVGKPGFTADPVGSNFSLAGDGSTLFAAFTTSNGVGVMKFEGGAWTSVGPASIVVSGSVDLLTIVSVKSKLYLAVGTSRPHVFALNGSDWTDQVTGLPADVSSLMFAADSDGTLYAAFNDSAAGVLSLCKYAGTAWTQVATSPEVIGDSWSPSLWVSGGTVFIIFGNNAHGAVVLKSTGSTLESVGALGSISNGDSIEYVTGAVSAGVPYVGFDNESRDSDPEPRAAQVKQWNGSAWVLYAGYPDPCDIENTFLYAESPGSRLFLSYSDCDGDLTVQVH